MKFRLLNLDRSADRLATFKRTNPAHAKIERFSAIDGALANRARLVANDVISADLRYSDGALGCAMTHLVQWRDAVTANEAITVIEDDAILAGNFVAEVERLTAGGDWDYVAWGWNFDAWMSFDVIPGLAPCLSLFDQDELRAQSHRFPAEHVQSSLFRLRSAFGTISYSVSPRGAQKLLNFCMPLRPMSVSYPGHSKPMPNVGIDNMLALAWPHISAHVALPPLAVTNNERATSTVQSRVSPPVVVREMNRAGDVTPAVAPMTDDIIPVEQGVGTLALRPAAINRSAHRRVPKILHYVFGMMPDFGGKPWGLVHYACLASAVAKIKPDQVLFHYEHEPSGPWWELTKPLVTLCQRRAPTEIFGNPLVHVAQRAGCLRLQVLKEHGGIYLDADVMVHRSFDDLLHYPAVMAVEGRDEIQGMADAIIVAEKGSAFIDRWFDTYRTFRARGFDKYWAEHGVRMPARLACQNPEDIRVLPYSAFFWPLWTPEHLHWMYESITPIDTDPYVNHLWEAVAWKYFAGLTPGQVRAKPSNFHSWLLPYLVGLPEDYGAVARAMELA